MGVLSHAFTFAAFAAVVAGCSGGATDDVRSAPGPQSWKVLAGSQTGAQAYQALAFYPNAITVDAGDTITWATNTAEPHTISFPIGAATPVPPTDPSAPKPAGGSTFDGTSYVSSGFIAGGQTYSLTFTKPGTYTYYSLPQLTVVAGTVVVQPSGRPYPLLQSGVTSAAKAQAAADISSAQNSVSTIPFMPGSNMIAAGVSASGAPSSHGTVMRFLDGPTETDNLNTTIKIGTTLTFENRSTNVPHTVTIPKIGGSTPGGPPFQPGTGTHVYDGTALLNSGVIPPGGSYPVEFVTPGVFTVHCLFHDDDESMIQTVTVIS